MPKYNIYMAKIDLTSAEEEKMKNFVRLMGYQSIKDFIRTAVLEKMANDIAKCEPAKRKVLEEMLSTTALA